jgi:conjugative transposon TraN protein
MTMMKKLSVLWMSLTILLFSGARVLAQHSNLEVIHPSPLSVAFKKTSNLLFPYAIKSVNIGSKDVLGQIAKGVENILQLKAAKQGFDETNLTVVTSDGKFYSYILNYTDSPSELNIKVGENQNYPKADAIFSYKSDNEARIYDITAQIAAKKPILASVNDKKYDMKLSLAGLYVKGDKLYFQLALDNDSQVDYNIQAIRFYIKDKKRAKRTASQEIEQLPVEYAGNIEIVRGKSKQTAVLTLSRFTIPDKKLLHIEMMEANGGRHLGLKISNKIIMGARGLGNENK